MDDRLIALAEESWRGVYKDEIPDGYIPGLGRDYPHPKKAHLYKGDLSDPGKPMCKRGWNRDSGQSYSIWRGNFGRDGLCETCLKRAKQGLDGVESEPPVDNELRGA